MLIRRKKAEEMELSNIVSFIKSGMAEDILSIGDEIEFTLKNGEILVMLAAGFNLYHENEVTFVAKNCLNNRMSMNTENTNEGGWKAAELRKKLKHEIFALLPDDLAAVIRKKKTVQIIDGVEIKSKDKLWIPTEREVFGDDAYESGCPDNEKQIPIFKDRANRIKKIGPDGSACNWWESSPNVGYSTAFCNVTPAGAVNDTSASYPIGLLPCFCI